ncbi:MAG: UDP-4-amino-4,6-dideoxy-N-acetyl-beta-L-altrosamine transaminase [Candidatus Omnitrophica bacterium]|nr:UDP-4-amino-4,6-dideoxy-N-acetyl-beta-L-altrosamine transaminase [Candidatus Omnitrophota bacterium]
MKNLCYGRQCIDSRDIEEVVGALRSDWLTQGPRVDEFESMICKYTTARYCVALSSGTAALHLACIACGLKPGDEAITSPITFLATSNAVLYTGAKPVFADIDPITVNINPSLIEKQITRKTKAILPVHFAGFPCDMERIKKIALKRSLTIIEDACHALGAEYRCGGVWHKTGSCQHSDMSVFSFHPVKSITTGEGGAITTNNANLYRRLRALRAHGTYKDKNILAKKGPWYYEMKELGFNYRLTDIQCSLGISQLKKLKAFIGKRNELAALYRELLCDCRDIQLPPESDNCRSACHLFFIRLKDCKKRRQVFEKLLLHKIRAQVHYIPVYEHPYYAKRSLGVRSDYPNADRYYRGTLSLPLHVSLKPSDIRRVVKILKDALR